MKTVSDKLFRLIKSLTSLEKGYFKKYASKNTPGEKNNYIILFDAIDSLEIYDENLLKKKLKNSNFITQLPVYKNYLFNLILKSLNSYSTYESVSTQISGLIQEAIVLSKKALTKEALKYLNRAKDLAVKFEKTNSMFEIFAAERSILMRATDKNTYKHRAKIYKEQLEFLKLVEKHIQLSWLSDKMVLYVEQTGDFRTEEREKEIKKIMQNPLLKRYEYLKDFTSKQLFLHIHIFEQLAKDDIKKVHYYLKKEIEMINEYKIMIPSLVRTYIHTLVNYLLFSNLLKDRASVKDALIKINQLKRMIKNKIPLDVEIMILSNKCYAEIIIYTNNCDMNKGRAAAKKVEQLLRDYPAEIPTALKVVLLLNTARFWFIDRNYENSLKLINFIINDIPASFRRDLYSLSRLFQLIIHFELGNFDVLENTLETAYRFMREHKFVFDVEASLFKFLRGVLRSPDNKYKDLYEELLNELEKSAHKTQSKITLGNFDFITWVKSKTMNKTMVELQKNENN